MMRFKGLVYLAVLLAIRGLFPPLASSQQTPIGDGTLYVRGIELTANPSQQTVLSYGATEVNTHLIFPDFNIGGTVITARKPWWWLRT